MTGKVETFYYPRLRDNLYRRTLIVLPNVGAVVSMSVEGQTESRSTVFILDRHLADSYAGEFEDVLKKCRPMMTAYSCADGFDDTLRCFSQFESDRGNRIQQSSSLSSVTSPRVVLESASVGSSAEERTATFDLIAESQNRFFQSLDKYEAIDIHSLATAEEVPAGRVPIAVSYIMNKQPLFYTPQTYVAHLESILNFMDKYENYHAVFLPRSKDTHALMVKEGRQTLLLRNEGSLMLFEISQPNIAEACREYLLRRVEVSASSAFQRKEAVSSLQRLINELNR